MRPRGVFKSSILLIFLVSLFFIAGQNPASAAANEQAFCFSEYDWNELEMGSFVIMFSLEHTGLAQAIFTTFRGELADLMTHYSQVFDTELVLPITIRIYPTIDDYYCLNPLASPVGTGAVHAHVGEREIALFADLESLAPQARDTKLMNALRFELAILFAEQISGGYAPQGLLVGLGGYAEDPADTFTDIYSLAGNPATPFTRWQSLWEETADYTRASYFLEATSIAAYLIDVHGWERFTELLEQIYLLQGYRQALIEVYDANLDQLQSHWQAYFPLYVSERWQYNIFHNYDLDTFQELISAGVYQDSIAGLNEAVWLLEVFGSPEQFSQAEQLLAKAELGVEAGDLAAQSRHALLTGRYLECYTSAEQALAFYEQLGDTRRFVELQAYKAVAEEVLDLRAGLAVIQEEGIGINPLRSQKVFDIGQRLLELGDSAGVAQAERILFVLGVEQNTFFQFLISLVVLISTGLIIRRILSTRDQTPPEADLL